VNIRIHIKLLKFGVKIDMTFMLYMAQLNIDKCNAISDNTITNICMIHVS
jgi:hypothetical protein